MDQVSVVDTDNANAFVPAAEDLRTEYSQLSQYHTALLTARFTTLGLFLAAVGFIVKDRPVVSILSGMLLAIISLAVLALDTRTKGISDWVRFRGMQIELCHWGFSLNGRRPYFTFLTYQNRTPEAGSINDEGIPFAVLKGETVNLRRQRRGGLAWLKMFWSHSLALRFIYVSVLVYSLTCIVLHILRHYVDALAPSLGGIIVLLTS